MKLYIIAGEASGDLHGSNLIKQLHAQQPNLSIRCWGGEMMQAAGAELVKHYRDLAFMGFIEVILNIRTIAKNLRFCKKDIADFHPDAIILIDYPGFNMRIAEWAAKRNIKVFYYISPQIWAWKENRVHQIKRDVTRMFVVLPFEKDFYKKHNYDVEFVGHPLLDVISGATKNSELFRAENNLNSKPIIAILPGSRKQEISRMLPMMLSVEHSFSDFQFVIAGAPGQNPDFYNQFLKGVDTKILFGKTYQLLNHAEAGLITSGTATLETGLFQLPQVVCYKANQLSYWIAKKLIKIKYISLVNLILDKPAVTELIQNDLNKSRIESELNELLHNNKRKQALHADYQALHDQLGGIGASQRTAHAMLKILNKT